MRRARSSDCSTTNTVVPDAAHPLQELDDALGDRRREPEGQLVDEQHVRARDQRHREGEQLLLAAREVARRLAHPGREHREPFERLGDVVVGKPDGRARASERGGGAPRP